MRRDGAWEPYALEINLRCGGTTHPLFALTSLTDGVYDPLAGEWRTRFGDIKHYAATDHLDSPAYRSLTPDDLLDVVAQEGLGWDGEREVGVVLHMVSAIAVAGRIGLTAIGDTLDEARRRYYDVKAAVDAAAPERVTQDRADERERLGRAHLPARQSVRHRPPARRTPEAASRSRSTMLMIGHLWIPVRSLRPSAAPSAVAARVGAPSTNRMAA